VRERRRDRLLMRERISKGSLLYLGEWLNNTGHAGTREPFSPGATCMQARGFANANAAFPSTLEGGAFMPLQQIRK
jgi:hypothetical protein